MSLPFGLGFAVMLRGVGNLANDSAISLQLEEVLGWTEKDTGQRPGRYCCMPNFRVALCCCPECSHSIKWWGLCTFLLVINECLSLILLAAQSAAWFSTWAHGFHSQQIEALCTQPRCHLSLKKLISSEQVVIPLVVDRALCFEVTVCFIISGDKGENCDFPGLAPLLSRDQHWLLWDWTQVGQTVTHVSLGFREPWFALLLGHLKLSDPTQPGKDKEACEPLIFH